MSSQVPVFCPKCGTQSVDGTRFCKHCGTNLEVVSRALTGSLVPTDVERHQYEVEYARRLSKVIQKGLGSLAIFVVFFLAFREPWTFFMLFGFAYAIRDFVQLMVIRRSIQNPTAARSALGFAKRDEKSDEDGASGGSRKPLAVGAPAVDLGPSALRAPTTGELQRPAFDPANPPPSVTEGTTRHLDEPEPARSAVRQSE